MLKFGAIIEQSHFTTARVYLQQEEDKMSIQPKLNYLRLQLDSWPPSFSSLTYPTREQCPRGGAECCTSRRSWSSSSAHALLSPITPPSVLPWVLRDLIGTIGGSGGGVQFATCIARRGGREGGSARARSHCGAKHFYFFT